MDDARGSRPAATALRESEENLGLLIEAVEDYALFMLDPHGRVTSWNIGAERISGYTADEAVGRDIAFFYPPEDAAAGIVRQQLQQAQAEGRFAADGRRRRRDDSRFFAHVVVTALYDDDATLRGFAMITRDISTRKQMEERFRLVVESAPSAMVMINAAGIIEMVNAQAERVFGYERAEMLGRPVEMLIPQRFKGHHPGLREAFFSSPLSRPMGAGRDLFGVRKDGSEFPVEIGLNPIETDEGPMVLSAIVDISTRKHLEERFRLVVESAPNAMVMVNQNGAIEMVNAQAERVFGYERSEMLGQPVEILIPQRFKGHHPGLRESFFTSPLSRPMGAGRDLFARRKDGSEFPVEIGLNPIETEQGAMVLSAIVDISDRKQKEDSIQRALAEKDILLGEIHHRVKNNLQIVHSLLDLQSAQISDPAVRDMLTDSQNRIRSMALIHQTLYLSRNFAAIDFSNVLGLICDSLLASYGVNDGRIRLAIDAGEMSLSINQAIPCGLIVNELVTNALKHAFPANRAGTISISLSECDGGAKLSVADDGVGIPAEKVLADGTTLGLQLVNLLTEQIGGTLEISRANPTRFVVCFKITKDKEP